jgi:hypothetical protein
MPSDAIERINILANEIQAGMNFTNMRNELYDDDEDNDSDSDADSDTDSKYNSDDASSDGEDDADGDCDDFIAGVDMGNPGNSDHDTKEVDENNNDGLSAGQDEDEDEDEVLDDVLLSEENVNKDVPTRLKNITDDTGTLPPIIQSRTRQQ